MYRFVAMFTVAMFSFGTAAVSGQDFPNKLIRITAAAVGGGSDFAARLLAPGLTESLGQPVIVDNRSNGILAIEAVAKAPADGYTLLVENTGFWTGPLLRKMSYDVVRDFSPITLTNTVPTIIVVHPSVPVNSVKDLIAFAKARPGAVNYGSSGTGTSLHLAGELFKSMTGVNIVHVPYKATSQAMTDVIGGAVPLMFSLAPAAIPHMKSGKLKALAVTSPQPSTLVPGLPTVAASGVPGYDVVSIQGLFAPAKTPAAIINRLNQEIVRAINRPEVKDKFLASGSEIAGSAPEQFAAAIKTDIAKWAKVIKEAGI